MDLKKTQEEIFRRYKMVPAPFPLLALSLSLHQPPRPSRREVSRMFPGDISLTSYSRKKGKLILGLNGDREFFPCDASEIEGITLHRGFVMNEFPESKDIDPEELPLPAAMKFRNFSVGAYEVDTAEKPEELFWKNMRWSSLWQVKKGK